MSLALLPGLARTDRVVHGQDLEKLVENGRQLLPGQDGDGGDVDDGAAEGEQEDWVAGKKFVDAAVVGHHSPSHHN